MKFRLLLLLNLLIAGSHLNAADIIDVEVAVSSDQSIEIRHYQADSETLLIWIPSERGISPHSATVIDAIADTGLNLWVVDLHGSYLVPTGRYSLNQFSPGDIVKIIDAAETQGYRQIVFVSASRGAELVLKSIYLYSSRNPDSRILKGSILFYPNLFKPVSAVGETAAFTEVSAHSHLPVYLIQAQYSTKYHFTEMARRQLQLGGSQVFVQMLENVEAGFVSRPPGDLSEQGLIARQRLPAIMKSAVSLMSQLSVPELKVADNLLERQNTKPASVSNFQPYAGDKTPPSLRLQNLQGEYVDLSRFKGRVVIVNFWASWCKPCVDEIPSLSRLGRRYGSEELTILTINTGEPLPRIMKFLQPFDINFEILLDSTGKAVRDWRVYAFPSNFLIDKNGMIQYGYKGALEWDSEEVVAVIDTLL